MTQRGMEEILETYNLRVDETKLVDIEVPSGQTRVLTTMPRPEDRGKLIEGVYKPLQPRSLEDIKKWIGVPDNIATLRRHPQISGTVGPASWRDTRIPQVAALPSPVDFDPEKVTIHEKRALKELARDYVYGDSKNVSTDHINLIEKSFPDWSIIVVPINNITIMPNSTFVVRKDIRVLAANAIRIYQGGKLLANSHLKINCASVQGNIPLFRPRPPRPIPILDTELEALGGK